MVKYTLKIQFSASQLFYCQLFRLNFFYFLLFHLQSLPERLLHLLYDQTCFPFQQLPCRNTFLYSRKLPLAF